MKERRNRKEMKADQQRHYEGLEELPVSNRAKERFRRPAYQASATSIDSSKSGTFSKWEHP